jgi:formyltetrahydrofolate hydrolase
MKFFWQKPKPLTIIPLAIVPQTDQADMDFEAMIQQLNTASKSAQMTFLYRYVQTLSPKMAKSLQRYVNDKLSSPATRALTNPFGHE